MDGLFRTAKLAARRAAATVACALAVAVALTNAACSDTSGDAGVTSRFNVTDFQYISDGSDGCPGPAGPALGILASGKSAMPGNGLKIAAGCRQQGPATEFGAVIELRAPGRDGRTESFEALDLVTSGECGDADLAWGLAVYRAVGHAAKLWSVGRADTKTLCDMIKNREIPRDLLFRALEEAATRKECPEQVELLTAGSDEDVVLRAIGTLGRIGSVESIPTLGSLAFSAFTGVPWAAAHAISDIGGPRAARALDIIAAQATTAELRNEASRLADRVRADGRDR